MLFMDVTLEVMQGSQRTRVIQLRVDKVTIGRKRGSHLRIPAASVSRQHCQLTFHEDTLVVEDLGSFNGTFVNGKRIKKRAFVQSGDRLKIGPITFRVSYGEPELVEAVEDIVDAVPMSRVFAVSDSVDLSQDFGEALLDMFDADGESQAEKPKGKGRTRPPPLPDVD